MLKDRLLKLRKNRRLTQQELSKIIGIARTTYQGYENGSREPDFTTLEKIADFFDVTTDYLLGRTDNPTGYPVHLKDLPPMERLAEFIKENDFRDLYFSRSGDYFDDLTSEEVDELIFALIDVKKDVARREREKENRKE